VTALRWRVFVPALVISAAAHALLIGGEWMQLPREPDEARPLAVQLAVLTLPAITPPRALPAEAPRPRARVSSEPRVLGGVPAATHPAATYSVPVEIEGAPADAGQKIETEAAPAQAEERTLVATAPASTFVPEQVVARSLPKKGRIAYALYYGADKFVVGRTVQSWEIRGDTYRIGSVSETTGLIDVFRSEKRTYLSEGRVTVAGLQPDSFLMSRSRRGETQVARARFDWAAGSVTIGRVPERHAVALTDGAQDLISFMYQFSLHPPRTGRITLPLTTGARFEKFEIDVLPEEIIQTPLGPLRALPVKQVRRPGSETIEVWLATEMRYLPVRIRFINREGEPAGEQLVSEIRISEE
jgi:hypothetical protein